jgi:hypothetical protein
MVGVQSRSTDSPRRSERQDQISFCGLQVVRWSYNCTRIPHCNGLPAHEMGCSGLAWKVCA